MNNQSPNFKFQTTSNFQSLDYWNLSGYCDLVIGYCNLIGYCDLVIGY